MPKMTMPKAKAAGSASGARPAGRRGRRLAKGSIILLALALGAGVVVKTGLLAASPTPSTSGGAAGAAGRPADGSATGEKPEGTGAEGGNGGTAAGPPGPKSPTIRLVIKTVPGKRAFVYWGKKKLGVTEKKAPLIIQRPRDSGPLDLLVKADDCVPVYTRAYTFDDNTLSVKVTALDQKQTIYGYKAELPPEEAAEGDVAAPGAVLPGGAAPAAGGRSGSMFTR